MRERIPWRQTAATDVQVRNAPVTPADDLLVEQVLAGDTAAFAALVERHKRRVYALAYRRLGNAADAEDAAQETFVRAYTRLATYRPGSRFDAWLLAIAANWCTDLQRSRRTMPLDPARDGAAGGPSSGQSESPEALILQAERGNEVREWLARLPEHYRAVLELRYWHELSYTEISAATAQPISTVRMRLFRGRRLLATYLNAS
ncbi:MAG TPA: sigma-70 family RNA polymerase sigma factor [Thermomicrobiales bacterium]|nr:sigma-70 family RNA polymerase sigma factor [Thermomicrobiales bacterium]